MAVNPNNNSMARKYYPNNVEALRDAPSEYFDECAWDDFVDWKLHGWELPSSVLCVIRVQNNTTGKVHEKTYQKPHAAKAYMQKLMDSDDEYEFFVCNAENIHHVFPHYEDQDDEDE